MTGPACDAIPQGPGVYALLLAPRDAASLVVGKLGTVRVTPGRHYVYVGSALSGLARRVGRHLAAPAKNKHWHVDYLLEHLDVRAVYLALTTDRKECEVSLAINALDGHFTPVKGFGNSDCRSCPSHLYEGTPGEGQDSIDEVLRAAFRCSGLQPSVVHLPSN
ncbi:MAG: GIY-YIG nuclease family protein [Candidatus Lokiarchaeota archaeon]|nr:GIY-YIG nuclease family protein [Candidatus Lokiarchaeota archaeon]